MNSGLIPAGGSRRRSGLLGEALWGCSCGFSTALSSKQAAKSPVKLNEAPVLLINNLLSLVVSDTCLSAAAGIHLSKLFFLSVWPSTDKRRVVFESSEADAAWHLSNAAFLVEFWELLSMVGR